VESFRSFAGDAAADDERGNMIPVIELLSESEKLEVLAGRGRRWRECALWRARNRRQEGRLFSLYRKQMTRLWRGGIPILFRRAAARETSAEKRRRFIAR